jgi:mono/diheme cytochrome c family protein
MNKPLRIAAYSLASLLVVITLAAAALLANSTRKLQRVVTVSVAPLAFTDDAAANARGKYLYLARSCAECHGDDGSGRVFIDHPNGLFARGANLTRGAGSAVLNYNESDWVRTIRHGVKPDGRPVFVMPSEDYNRFTDADLSDLVAYVRSLPTHDAPSALIRLPLIAKLAHGAGVLKDAAEKIDHTRAPSQPVPAGVSVEHGRYVAQACVGCHGLQLRGGRIPGAPPDWPPAADLKGAESALRRYPSVERFKTLLRSGMRPDGTQANSAMPRNKHLNDTDLEALFAFLRSGAAVDASP